MLVEMRNTLPPQAVLLARLRALVDAQRSVSFERRYLDLIAQRNLRKGDKNDAMKIIAVAFEELMRLYRHHDIKVSLRATAAPRVPFALVADAGSIFHASRDADTDRMTPVGEPSTVALKTGMSNHLPGTVTDRASARDGEKTLLITNLSTAAALLACFRATAGRRAGATTLDANLSATDLDVGLLAENGFLKLQAEIVADVPAALRAPIAAPATHVEHFPKKVAEDISHVGVGKTFEARSPGTAHPRVPEAIVSCTFLRVGEYLVRFTGQLELLFRIRVIRVAVGMTLHGQTAVRGLQLLIVTVAGHTQKFVVFDFGHFR